MCDDTWLYLYRKKIMNRYSSEKSWLDSAVFAKLAIFKDMISICLGIQLHDCCICRNVPPNKSFCETFIALSPLTNTSGLREERGRRHSTKSARLYFSWLLFGNIEALHLKKKVEIELYFFTLFLQIVTHISKFIFVIMDFYISLFQAYSLYDEEVSYCQGLSFLAASLLLHVRFFFSLFFF